MSKPSPEELEARLTALLLGELPAEEAAALRQALEQDAELGRLCARLKQTIELVRETAVNPAEPAVSPAAPLKLAEQRREKLLQHFKAVAPKEFAEPRRREVHWLVPMAAAAVVVGIIGAVLLPTANTIRSSSVINQDAASLIDALQDRSLESLHGIASNTQAAQLAQSAPAEQSPIRNTASGQVGPALSNLDSKPSAQPSAPIPLPEKLALNNIVLPSSGDVSEADQALERKQPRQDVGVYDLANVDPQDAQRAMTDLFNRNNVRSSSGIANSKSLLGLNNPLTQRASGAGGGGGIAGATPPPRSRELAGNELAYKQDQSTTLRRSPAQVPGQSSGSKGGEIDPATGLPVGSVVPGYDIDPATGLPVPPAAPPSVAEPAQRNTLGGLATTDGGLAESKVEALGELPALGKSFSKDSKTPESLSAGWAPPTLDVANAANVMTWGAAVSGVGVTNSFNPASTLATTAYPANGAISDAYFTIDPQTRRVVVTAPEGTMPYMGVVSTNSLDVPGQSYFRTGNAAGDALALDREKLKNSGLAFDDAIRNGKIELPNESQGYDKYTLDRNVSQLGTAAQPPAAAQQSTIILPPAQSEAEKSLTHAGTPWETQYALKPPSGGSPETATLSAPPPEDQASSSTNFSNVSAVGYVNVPPSDTHQVAIAPNLAEDTRRAKVEPNDKSQAYLEAKRKLEELQRFRQLLELHVAQEGIDYSMPKSATVDIVDAAIPPPNPTLWQKVRGAVTGGGATSAHARVKVERDQVDIAGLAATNQAIGFDPYFVQTESELIQSEAVLGDVIKKLNLDEAWAKKRGAGGKLTTQETMRLLKKSLDLRPERNTSLLDIGVKSDNPEEAVKIANAVAEAYRDHRAEQRVELAKAGIKAAQEQLQAQEIRVQKAQEEVASLSKEQATEAKAGPSSNIPLQPAVAADEMLPAGAIDFRSAKVDDVLKVYGELVNRKILSPTNLTTKTITLNQTKPLTKREAVQAIDAALGLNGFTMINIGDQYVKAVEVATASQTGEQSDKREANHPAAAGQYVTHLVQLQHTKPSELVEALRPFSKMFQAVLPIDDSQILVLRDTPENVSRMLETVAKIDVAKDQTNAASGPARRPAAPADAPQPEVQTRDAAFSTFSLNVSDVSFKLAAASLAKGVMPEAATVRSEEFINAFDYRDPEPAPGAPLAFAWERARYPFAQNRDLLRFSIKTAALGREPGRPLNLVLLLDNSGSMERADRVRIIHEALRVLAAQLQPQDKFSIVTFARTARLWVDGVSGSQAAQATEQVSGLTPQGGTNLEDAMNLAYQTALRHYLANGVNRVVLLTDGAANLGNVDPAALQQKVEAHRNQGVALDCFGIGWEGYNDDLLEVLSRHGDGRYGFVNTPEEAASEFAGQLAGALRVAAADVKVQIEFNPGRVTAYRQIGYAKHQLTKEQFRDNTVDAAEIGAAESGNALYVIEVNPRGEGPLGTVRVRYKVPATSDVHEHEWAVPYTGNAVALDQASPAMRLAATASAFSEWLVSSPYAAEVTPKRLLGCLSGVPEICGADARPKKLESMIRQAQSLVGQR